MNRGMKTFTKTLVILGFFSFMFSTHMALAKDPETARLDCAKIRTVFGKIHSDDLAKAQKAYRESRAAYDLLTEPVRKFFATLDVNDRGLIEQSVVTRNKLLFTTMMRTIHDRVDAFAAKNKEFAAKAPEISGFKNVGRINCAPDSGDRCRITRLWKTLNDIKDPLGNPGSIYLFEYYADVINAPTPAPEGYAFVRAGIHNQSSVVFSHHPFSVSFVSADTLWASNSWTWVDKEQWNPKNKIFFKTVGNAMLKLEAQTKLLDGAFMAESVQKAFPDSVTKPIVQRRELTYSETDKGFVIKPSFRDFAREYVKSNSGTELFILSLTKDEYIDFLLAQDKTLMQCRTPGSVMGAEKPTDEFVFKTEVLN